MPTPSHPERVWSPAYVRAYGAGRLQFPNQAWAIFLGYIEAPGVTAKHVECLMVTDNAAGTQTAEMGLYSSPHAPNGARQTLTRIVASGSLTDMTAGPLPRIIRTPDLAARIPGGTHLWAVWRCAFGGTQPTIAEGTSKTPLGDVLYIAGPRATTPLTDPGAASLALTLPPITAVNHACPYLWMTED